MLPVELPGSLCPDSPAASAYLAVQVTAIEPGWTWAHEPAVGAPATAYLRDSSVFTCAPATTPAALAAGNIEPGDIIDGFLALAETDFEVVGVDLDGALLQALALADNLANDPTTADGLLAALRSSGLSLLADNRAQQVLQAIQDNQAFGAALSGQTVRPLTARDVTRGFRMDIFSDRHAGLALPAPPRRPLCPRQRRRGPGGRQTKRVSPSSPWCSQPTTRPGRRIRWPRPRGYRSPAPTSTSTSEWLAGTGGRCRPRARALR